MAYTPRLIALEGKHPADVVDYSLRLSGWLDTAETLSTVSVTVPSGITLGGSPAPAITDDDVVFWLSGGTSGTTYAIEVTVTTSGGRTLVVDCAVLVTDPTP